MVSKKLLMIVGLFGAVCSGLAIAAENNAGPQQSLCDTATVSLQNSQKTLKKTIGEEDFITESLSHENEQFIRCVQQEMGMADWDISLRKMNKEEIKKFGEHNAFVVPSSKTNLMVISDEWFATLPEQEKRFIIGHELAHLKKLHIAKYSQAAVLVRFLLAVVSFRVDRWIEKTAWYNSLTFDYKELLAKCLCYILPLLDLLPLNMVSRAQEKEADITSAEVLNNADGGVQWVERMMNVDVPTSGSSFKQWWSRLWSAHPLWKDRHAYLLDLAAALKQKKALVKSEPSAASA